MSRFVSRCVGFLVLCSLTAGLAVQAATPTCANAAIRFNDDFSWVMGSADYLSGGAGLESGSVFRLTTNATVFEQGLVREGLLLHFDNSSAGQGGETPVLASGIGYTNGYWGSALMLANNGNLRYPRAGNFYPEEGTIEMWIALREAGSSAVYTNSQVLWQYYVSASEYLVMAQSGESGVVYAGGVVGGQWQSAYAGGASMRSWRSNDWHHIAFTFSAVSNYMRFYLDGVLRADSNEHHYWPPGTNGTYFTIGGDRSGNVAKYLIDELRISGRAASSEEIAARARRSTPAAANEVWLSTTNFHAGDVLGFEFAPSDGSETGATCVASISYTGIPLFDASPPSTLLLPGTASLNLSLRSYTNTSCRYALGQPLSFEQMTPFDAGAGGTNHSMLITGLNTNANFVNHVYVRCAAWPDFVMDLRYRCLSVFNPRFPRTGNLWGWGNYVNKTAAEQAKIDLWLGADMQPEKIAELRGLNPDIVVLTSINAIENGGLTEDYYFHDIQGNRVEVWPGAYRLNITKPYVAEFQARLAARLILDSGLMFDGCFFDNVMLSQSWQKTDIYGNPFLADYNEDGVVDDPVALDTAWRAGVMHEMDYFRQLMPNALMSGHAMGLNEPGIANLFNGISIGFESANVIEGETGFGAAWSQYAGWCTLARPPQITMVESSPIDDIAYGYDYAPWGKIPPATLDFTQHYYPWMRFGLALTLMQDGYFAHEYGDTWHGNDWWYDELDFDLGYPLGPAQWLGQSGTTNYVANGDFESTLGGTWNLWADSASGYTAAAFRVTSGAAAGTACARIDISATQGENWRVDFAQFNRSLKAGVDYEVVFWARATALRPITLAAQKGSPDWRNYGLQQTVTIDTNWTEYLVTFTATETTTESRLQFLLGATTGTVWLDNVRLRQHGAAIYQREFDNGLVILNGSRQTQTIDVGPGFRRLIGSQAPQVEYIIDDSDTAFSAGGAWSVFATDSGEWKALGPFYHDWGTTCRLAGAGVTNLARWTLSVPANDLYAVSVWWAATPSNNWSKAVLYELVSGSDVLASAIFDESTNGDQWHFIGQANLTTNAGCFVRAHSLDGAGWVADAIHVTSTLRYNDGSSARSVVLQALDGIVLQREPGTFPDRDRDGLPDYWEENYFGNPTNAVPLSDPESDGISNIMEYALGLNPILADQSGLPTYRWNPVTAKLDYTFFRLRPELVYTVECSTNLADWATLISNPGTAGEQVTVSYGPGSTGGFLRLRVGL